MGGKVLVQVSFYVLLCSGVYPQTSAYTRKYNRHFEFLGNLPLHSHKGGNSSVANIRSEPKPRRCLCRK